VVHDGGGESTEGVLDLMKSVAASPCSRSRSRACWPASCAPS
jgi:hypothetical protein